MDKKAWIVSRLIDQVKFLDVHWIFVVDGLNVHKSEALVRFAAKECGIDEDLGKKA